MHGRIALALLVCLALSGCRKPKSTDELLGDLQSAEEKERLIAVRLLPQRQTDAARVVPGLIAALKDAHADIRRSAALGLGNFGAEAKAAIPALQAALTDRDARVREAAGLALSRIDPAQFPAPGKAPPGK